MNLMNWRRNASHLSAAAGWTLVTGFALTGLLFTESLQQGWFGALIGAGITVTLASYLQAVARHSRHAAAAAAQHVAERESADRLHARDAVARDVSDQALHLRDRAIELSANAISMYDATDPDFPLCYINPAFERMTGYRNIEILGTPCCVLHGEEPGVPALPLLRILLDEKRAGNLVLRNQKKDGGYFWSEMRIAPVANPAGHVSHFVASQTDLTAVRFYEEQLQHKAHYDALTGLANRVLLRDRLAIALQFSNRGKAAVWVLFLGLDRFKVINETSGHDVGDAVLKQVGSRLTTSVARSDTVARFAGDEFVIILQSPPDEKAAMQVVETIISELAKPILHDGQRFFLGCSIGIAIYPNDGQDAETLIMHADCAMHVAKSRGYSGFHFYTPHMNQRALQRARMEQDLRIALEQGQFILHYQPQVDLGTGAMVGMEALIRWQHPERGQIAPIEFIGLAEETGLIVDIGAWVIRTACAQLKQWQRLGFVDLRVSVNLSARQFADENLVASIASVLASTALDARLFQLELTESLVMADVERGIGIMRDLKALGISLAVDDFGTGYSSLAYLRRLPIDTLKIDRSFVNDIALEADDAVIVSSIISLAHSLRLCVIAEGVESQEQLAFLQNHGCDEIQGYYFSRPVTAADFSVLLQQGKSLAPSNHQFHEPPRLVKA